MMNLAALLSFFLGVACVHSEQTTSVFKSKPFFSNVIQVECDGIDINTLDDISLTVFSQAIEESYDDVDNTKTNGTYINVGWACLSSCKIDDRINPKKRRPRLVNNGVETIKFEVDWMCGDSCPDTNFATTSFTRSTSTQASGHAKSYNTGSLRGSLPTIKGDVNVAEWEKNLVRTLIDSRRKEFRPVEVCTILTVPSDNLSVV
jgi:hypothetical protein